MILSAIYVNMFCVNPWFWVDGLVDIWYRGLLPTMMYYRRERLRRIQLGAYLTERNSVLDHI